MPRNRRKKKRTGAPPLPSPAPSLRPLPRKDRILIQLMAVPMYLMALALAYGAVDALRTGVTPGRGEAITRADGPFGFYSPSPS